MHYKVLKHQGTLLQSTLEGLQYRRGASHMLLMWTEIEASVPMPCFSMSPISSLSVR